MRTSLKYTLRNIVTLRYLAPRVSERLFFIFGCQRSGTTLLLSMLSAHPNITGTDETEFPSPYPFPSAQRLLLNRLTGQYACFKMLEHSNKLEFLSQFYPRASVLWPVRNPHSTISSMLNLTNSEGSWINRCADSEIERLKPFFPDQLGGLMLSEISPLKKASLYWTYKNKYVNVLKQQGFKVFPFLYEDLLSQPEKTLRQMVDFLGIDWSEDLLLFYQKNTGKSLAGGTRTDLPINTERANKLQSDLSAEDVAIINHICEPVMKIYGYPAL
ncbi:MAG: sulfotransferase [Cyanobacteria bacterium J06634_6]